MPNVAAKARAKLAEDRERLIELEETAGAPLVAAVEALETMDETVNWLSAARRLLDLVSSCERGYTPTIRQNTTQGAKVGTRSRVRTGRVLRLRRELRRRGLRVYPAVQVPTHCSVCGAEACEVSGGTVEGGEERWRCQSCGCLESRPLHLQPATAEVPEGWRRAEA